MPKEAFTYLDSGMLFFVQDKQSQTFHLWSSESLLDLEEFEPYICGLRSATNSRIVDNGYALVGLRQENRQTAVLQCTQAFHEGSICGNCYRSLLKKLKEQGVTLNEVLNLRWESYQANQMVQMKGMARTRSSAESGMPNSQQLARLPFATPSKSKEYNVTTEIVVNIKITYDLGELCPTEVVDAVEEVKEKANELGSVEEINLTTDGSLDVEVQF